jgi:hypothetical protein
MALYIPASRRRRNAILLAVGCALVALAIGYLIGRQSTPSVSAQVAAVQLDGQELATRLEALPIEYDQALAGKGEDTIQGGTLDALDGIQHDTIRTMDRAPWVQAAERAKVLDAIAAASQAARSRADSASFLAAVTAAATEVRAALGSS